ncbi:hypothetical protein [Hallella sp.]|uniref:hypothetical protein n=1 Tax=Hallella sp. TaxID=2980186 RepID=UPI00307AE562
MIEIKRNNKVFFTLEDVCDGSKLSRQLMDHHYIILKFSSDMPVHFEVGDSVEIPDFGYFELTSAYFPKYNNSTGGYDYEMQMDAYYMAWKNKLCKFRPQHGANETSFKLTTKVSGHLSVILSNLKALGLTYNGKDFSVDYTTYNKEVFDTEKHFYVEYSSISILEALNAICESLDCEWWVDGSIIYLGYCELSGQTTFEHGVNMLSMSQSASKSSFITRLYAFGSDKNIPTGYFTGPDADATTDGIATDYLMLPTKGVDKDGFFCKNGYMENANVVKNDKQAIEGIVIFSDEYPKVGCTVSNIKTYDSTVEENGEKVTETFWQVASSDRFATSFSASWIKRNLTLMIKFTSGSLMGMEFEASFKVIEQDNYFEIVANDTYGRKLPDPALCPKVGDKFFIYNWDATKITETDLIQEAQESLFERAKTYYKKSMIDNSNFTCELDGEKFYNHGIYDYHPIGEQVKLIDPMFSDMDTDGKHYRNSRIIGMEIKLDIPYDGPQYIVGEKAAYSRLGQLEEKVDSITVNGIKIGSAGSGGGVYVIGTNDSTPVTDSNVFSARRSRQEFLSKKYDDVANGHVTFQKGITSNGDIEVNADLHASGDLSTNSNLHVNQSAEIGQDINVRGNATIGGDLGVTGNATLTDVVVDRVHDAKSTPAERVIVGAQGFDLYMGEDGKSHLYIDYLTARTKFFAASAEVRKVSYSGGTTLFSNAGSTIMKVVDVLNESKTVIAYKCYALADDGTTKTMNWWHPGMMALCQTFNVKAGDTANLANRYYWRLVVGVGQETLNDGKLYDYVILSNKKTFVGNEAVVPVGSTQVIGWNGHPLVFGNVAIEVGSKGGMESFATVVADYEGLTNDESGTAIASRMFYGYEPAADGGEPDAPLPYDVIVQAGDQVQWGKYGNLIKHTTSVEDGMDAANAPASAMYHNMGAPYKVGGVVNPYQWKTLTSLDSPELVLKNANNFKFFTDDDPNNVIDPITVSYEINASSDFIIRKPTTQTATPTDMTFTVTKRTGSKTEDVTATVNLFADYTTTDGVTNADVPIKRLSDLGVSFYTLASVTIKAKDKSGGDTLTSISIPVLADGENGKNGTSVTIKGSLDSVDQLPTTGKENESYIIAGDLWAYTGTSKEDAENHNGFTNMGRIKGEDGKSATQYYIHTAWMKAADGTGFTVDNPNGAAYPYIGTLVDANEKASINWSDYKWTYVKGDDVTISSKSVTYAISADGINHPSVWSPNIIEATNQKPYLWTRTLVTYKDSLGEHPVISYSVSHKGKDGQNGDPGTDGKDAVEFVIKDAPMVFDTATDGVVPTNTSNTAKIYVYRGGVNVSTQPIAGIVDQQGCSGARVTKFSDHFEVTLEGRYIKKDGGVSVTSGYVAVQFTYDGKAYVQQVPFLVNVAKFTGTVNANNTELSSKYTELSNKQTQTAKDVSGLQTTLNGVPIKNNDDLSKYTSEIKQTAREISVEVSSEAVRTGRNMLLGSDFHRQGYGYVPNGTAFTESNLKIRTYDGFADCNSLFIEQTAIGNSYAGVRWSDVPVTGGKTYVISAWLKRMSDTFGDRCSIIVHEYAGNGTTIAKNNSFTALDADADPKGTWRKKAITVTLQATTTRVNVIFCLGSTGAFSLCQPMMEEGTESNGWTLAPADYGYIMGNRIVGSLALTKHATSLAQDGSTASIAGLYGSVVTGTDGVAMVERDAQATKTQLAIVVQGYLKANTDYVLSFDVRRIDGKDDGCAFVSFVRKVLYSELYSGKVSIYSKENGNATESGYLEIKPSGDWQRVWVHFRLAADWTDATGKNFNIGVFGSNGTGNSIRAQFRRPKLEACAAMTEYTDAQADYIEDENISKQLRRTGIDITNERITLDAKKTTVTGDLTVQGIITDSTSYVDVDGTLWSPNDVGELVNTKKNLRTVDGGVFVPIDMTTIKSIQIQTADPVNAVGPTDVFPVPALVALPMYDAVNLGCGITIPAYRRSGTHVLIRNAFALPYSLWAKSASWGDANNKYTALRNEIANTAVYICTDPRLLSLDNYKYATPTITPDGQDYNGVSATAEWFKGGCFLNGRRGRWIALLPGQEIELVSVITMWKTGTNTAVPYLAWYIVGGSNIDWLDKLISIRPADSAYNGYDGYFEQEITGGQNFGVGSIDKYRDAFFGPRQLSDGYVDGLAAQTVVVTLSANEAPYLSVQ